MTLEDDALVNPNKRFHYFYVTAASNCNTSHWTTIAADRREINVADLRELRKRLLAQAKEYNPHYSTVDINPITITYLGAMTVEEWNANPYIEETPN